MPPRIRCPYGEPRGAAVYCRAAGRVVNALVFPCRSPRYAACRFYRAAEEARKREEPEAPREEAPSAGRRAGEAAAAVRSAPEAPGQEPARAGVAVEGWSREESEKLADPLIQARLLLEGVPTAGGRVKVGGLQDLVRRIAERTGLSPDKCYVAVLSSRGRSDVFVKICGGRLVASATREGPLEPGELDEELRRLGEAALVVYEIGRG